MSRASRRWFVACGATVWLAFPGMGWSVEAPPPAVEAPKLELIYTAVVGIAPIETVGDTRDGVQRIIPLTGGTFEGPAMRGTVPAGGADWNLARTDGTTSVEAYYFMRTSDGVLIKIVNRGVIPPRAPPSANTPTAIRYFTTTPVFEAPKGKYEWLNAGAYVGTVTPAAKGTSVTIRVYKVN